MNIKNQQLYGWIGVAVIVIAALWLSLSKKADKQPAQQQQNQNQQQTVQPTDSTPSAKSDVWTGTLQKSDNAAKGNLLLVTSERNIYIRSNRDFSSLIGKKVRVSYEGTWQNFVLGDITLSEQE
ncbi:MAG: hypothetical protein HY918_04190 [Candidatus Doudnabacteria bacterium]|nr:hypothetical protein [Candidatus Doudnabacteria bacterium]